MKSELDESGLEKVGLEKLAPKKIRAVIFDIGRVLVRLDIAGAMGGLAGTYFAHATRNLGRHRTRPAMARLAGRSHVAARLAAAHLPAARRESFL